MKKVFEKLLVLVLVLSLVVGYTQIMGVWAAEKPYIFNWSETAMPDEVIGFQGHAFGSSPKIMFKPFGEEEYELPLITKSDTYVAAIVPADEYLCAYEVRILNGSNSSQTVTINKAVATTIEFDELAPSSPFRIFGKNLYFEGYKPVVSFVNQNNPNDVKIAEVITSESDPYILKVITPSDVTVSEKYKICVNNGMSDTLIGDSFCEETVKIRNGGKDVFELGTPWGADYESAAENVINVVTSDRLTNKAVPNDKKDDRAAIQEAMNLAANDKGGVVYLPAGTYNVEWEDKKSGLSFTSGVVLQGAGKDASGNWKTVIQYAGPDINEYYAVSIEAAAQRTGICDIYLQNIDGGKQNNLKTWYNNDKFFVKNVKWDFGIAKSLSVMSVKNMLFDSNLFRAFGVSEIMDISRNSSYVTVRNTDHTFMRGRIEFSGGYAPANNVIFENNHYKRDASYTGDKGLEAGGIEFSGSQDVVVLNNTFEIINGVHTVSNDGETILTQYCNPKGQARGMVTDISGLTISDNSQKFEALPKNLIIAIVDGVGTGQWRSVVSNTENSITVDRPWDVEPTAGSKYILTAWSERGGTAETLIKGNVLIGGNRGIWLYGSAAGITIVENHLIDSEGIWSRASHYDMGRYNLNWNILIADNIVENTKNLYPAYISANVPVNRDNENLALSENLWGTGILGVEVRRNTVQAYKKGQNTDMKLSQGIKYEGYSAIAGFNADYNTPDPKTKAILGTIFDKNTVINADNAFYTTNGVYQTVLRDMKYINVGAELVDNKSAAAGKGSTDTTVIALGNKELTNKPYKIKSIPSPIPPIPTPTPVFTDIDNHWAYQTINKLVSENIISGYSDGTFRPEGNINVDEFVKLIVCALGNSVQNGESYWASTYIDKAKELDILKDGEFEKYDRPINRSEICRMIVRALEEDIPENNQGFASVFSDYDTIGEDFKEFVQIAYYKGIVLGFEDKTFKPENNATRAESAVLIDRLINPGERKMPLN